MSIKLTATTRTDLGKGASRRLRHADLVPAIVYGANKEAVSLTFTHKEISKAEGIESFYSSILNLEIDGVSEQVVLKDLQRHAFKERIQHLDLLRVDAKHKLHTTVPLHFINEDITEAVKNGGVVYRSINDIEVLCLPADLPSFIEVDISKMEIGDTLHLSDILLPANVESVALNKGEEYNVPMVSIAVSKTAPTEEDEAEAAAAVAAAEAPTAE
ncbi:MAG: large subunit ribosomal protein L25 [Psychromonas sp.]|jgi:large subunit ribosomal protein L25|uniref:50S ribosomal protein L25/general stress protein Ctc n=1 Tax=Psychromonas sp. TaxID=1884585 RepID=UPI0039E262DC